MFLARRKEIESLMKKAITLEKIIKDAEIRNSSVVRVVDVLDVLMNGSLSSCSLDTIVKQYQQDIKSLWTDELYTNKLLDNMEAVYHLLDTNVYEAVSYTEPVFGLRLSSRQSTTADNAIKKILDNDNAAAISEFLDCLMDETKNDVCDSVYDRKLTTNEVILLKEVALVIARFSKVTAAYAIS